MIAAPQLTLPRSAGNGHLPRGRSPGHGVYLVIRYDDYGAAYSPACPARFEVEAMLHRETSVRGWPWLCGVTPRQSVDPHNATEQHEVGLWDDSPRVALLRRAVHEGLCEPAVHGLTHHTWKQLPRWGTEFAGLPVERQYDILCLAKSEVEELAGQAVSVFVPPWNSYDQGTLEAAARAGLGVFSAGLITHLPGPAPVHKVPSTVELIHLRQLMDRGHRFPPGSVVVVLLHGTDFVGVDRAIGYLELDEFGPLLDRAVEHFGMEVVSITQVPGLAGAGLEARGDCAASLFHRRDRVSRLPWVGRRLERWLLPLVSALTPAEHGRGVIRGLNGVLAAWFIGIMALACVPAGLIALGVERGPWRAPAWVGLAFLGLALVLRSGRYAFLKRYRARWGTRRIGLRTWTWMLAGSGLMISSLLSMLIEQS